MFECQKDELRQLQLNLVRSHACGIGKPLSEPEVRAMMLLRANVLTLGFSGIRWDVIELLCEMLNRRLYPVVPEKGSVGASGDLAPLAHLALSVIGEGEVFFEGQRMATAEAFRRAKLKVCRTGSEGRFGPAQRDTSHARGRRVGAFTCAAPRTRSRCVRRDESRSAQRHARRIRS